jgi:hypothetical protein
VFLNTDTFLISDVFLEMVVLSSSILCPRFSQPFFIGMTPNLFWMLGMVSMKYATIKFNIDLFSLIWSTCNKVGYAAFSYDEIGNMVFMLYAKISICLNCFGLDVAYFLLLPSSFFISCYDEKSWKRQFINLLNILQMYLHDFFIVDL